MAGYRTPESEAAGPPQWLPIAAGAFALLAALVAVAAPGAVARRLTVTTLPADADLTYARELLRYLGIAAAFSIVLGLVWLRLAQRRDHAIRRWAVVAALALYAAAAASMWRYVDDDAGISFTYARNVAEGRGLVYNPGDPPVEGYSNPLWVAILAAAHLAHLDIILTSKVLGLLCGAACLLLMGRALRGFPPIASVALPLAALNAAAIVWTNSGLENGLHALLLTATIVLLPGVARRERSPWLLVAVVSALAVSRPEGPMFGVAAAAYLAWIGWREPRSTVAALQVNRRAWIPVLTAPLVVFAAMVTFRLCYFGDPLPNTFYAKASSSNPLRLLNPASGGWTYVADAVAACGWTLGLLAILVACVMPRPPQTSGGESAQAAPSAGPALAALVIVAAQLFFVVSVGGDWMKEFRFIAPIVPAVSLLIGVGLARVTDGLAAGGLARGRAAAACIVLAVLIAYPQVQRLIVFAHDPTTPLRTVAAIGDYFKELGRRAGLDDPVLLHHDAGGTSFLSRIHLLDLAGLCDRTIAHQWRDREAMRRYIFEERRPDFIYSGPHFAERIGLESFPEFEADYVPLPPAPSPELDGYIRRVRRDLYARVFGEPPPDAATNRSPS